MSLRSSDHMSDTFQSMFTESEIAKQFSMPQQKASTLFRMELGLFLKIVLSQFVKSRRCI